MRPSRKEVLKLWKWCQSEGEKKKLIWLRWWREFDKIGKNDEMTIRSMEKSSVICVIRLQPADRAHYHNCRHIKRGRESESESAHSTTLTVELEYQSTLHMVTHTNRQTEWSAKRKQIKNANFTKMQTGKNDEGASEGAGSSAGGTVPLCQKH